MREEVPNRQDSSRRSLKKLDVNYATLTNEVTDLYVTRGYTRVQVIQVLKRKYTKLPYSAVHNIINRYNLTNLVDAQVEEARESIIKDKIPVINGIVNVNLHTLLEFSCNLATDPERKGKLSIKEAKDLSSLITELNNLIRLETGKPTANISISHYQGSSEELLKTAREIIEMDPVHSEPSSDSELPEVVFEERKVEEPIDGEDSF